MTQNIRLKRWIAVGVALLLLILLIFQYSKEDWLNEIQLLIKWIEMQGWAGQAMFVVIVTLVCMTSAFPASLIVAAAGIVYGVWVGLAVAVAGVCIAALLAFVLSRYLFRRPLNAWIESKVSLTRLGHEISASGWRFAVLIRMCPIAPFGIVSYAFGLSPIATKDYLIGTVGSFPAIFAYVYLGYVTDNAIDLFTGNTDVQWPHLMLVTLSVVATTAILVYLYRTLRRVFAKVEA